MNNYPFNSGPIAPYRNVPIHPEYYEPSVFTITAISEGLNTIVTTSVAHNYVVGQEVKLLIPVVWGAYQLNNRTGFVISIPAANQVKITIDSFHINAFGLRSPSPQYPQIPQIIAIGDINQGNINASGPSDVGTGIPGAFINISPN